MVNFRTEHPFCVLSHIYIYIYIYIYTGKENLLLTLLTWVNITGFLDFLPCRYPIAHFQNIEIAS